MLKNFKVTFTLLMQNIIQL